MSVADRVKKQVAEQLGLEVSAVTEDKTFDSLGVDSLDAVELVMAIEDEFSIEIDDDTAQKVATVGEAITLVTSLTS